MKKNNRGFSLVELIIVIGIMGVLTSLAGLGLGYLHKADVKGVTNQINSSLSELKTQTMAKNKQIYLHLSLYGGTYYLNFTEASLFTPDGTGKEIGSDTVNVSCDGTMMTEGQDICFTMRKKDGAVTTGPEQIEIGLNGSAVYTIFIVKDTGRHYIES